VLAFALFQITILVGMTVCGVSDVYWSGAAIVFCIILVVTSQVEDDMRNIRRTTMLVKTRCYHYDLNHWAIAFKIEDCRPTLKEDARHMRTCPTIENPMHFPTSQIDHVDKFCRRGSLSCALYHNNSCIIMADSVCRINLREMMFNMSFKIGFDDHSGRRIQIKEYVNENAGMTWYEVKGTIVYHRYDTSLYRDWKWCRERFSTWSWRDYFRDQDECDAYF
jgi:hypothetical protein